MSDTVVAARVDTSEIDRAEKKGLQAAARITRSFRRATQLGLLTVQAAGIMIDETLRLQVEAAALILESTVAIAAAGLNPTALLRLAQVGVILLQINALNAAREDAARRLGAVEQGLDMLLY